MARPREFDLQKAVEDAMNVFWMHGYAGTRLPDLLEGMQISRGSLYKAFGSKKELFLQALALYDERNVRPAEEFLSQTEGPSGIERIGAAFDGAVARVGEGDRRGCLLCNTAAGVSFEDEEIAKVVNDMLDRLAAAFAAALDRDGARDAKSPDAYQDEARSLTLAYVGLKVLVRAGTPEVDLKKGTDQTIANLRANATLTASSNG